MGIEVLKGKFLKKDVLDMDLGQAKFDRELNGKFAGKHRGSVRLSQGRYYTAEEWKEKREKLIKLSWPK